MTFYSVAGSPTLLLVVQTSATSVIVEWSQPSGGATVTGYVVHYSHGDNDNIITECNKTDNSTTDGNTTDSNMTESGTTESNITECKMTNSNTTDSNMTESSMTDGNSTDSNIAESKMTKSVPASSTHALITNLTECYNYKFSVEATSEHLSGISKILFFKLGMELQVMEILFQDQFVSVSMVLSTPTL